MVLLINLVLRIQITSSLLTMHYLFNLLVNTKETGYLKVAVVGGEHLYLLFFFCGYDFVFAL